MKSSAVSPLPPLLCSSSIEGYCINILDTPGHQDFSEDTYRTLMAADSAVMVIDAAKGVEAQTRKLFKVCAMRHIPIFTFINKMDREARDPFELMEEIENELGIETYPMNWPIGCGKEFKGVYDRGSRKVLAFEQRRPRQRREAERTRSTAELGDTRTGRIDRRELTARSWLTTSSCWTAPAKSLTWNACSHGQLSPVFFGSALTNFGVEPFLEEFLRMTTAAAAPQGCLDRRCGGPVAATHFSALCVQNPGQHEQGAPRPHCVHAHLLRQV